MGMKRNPWSNKCGYMYKTTHKHKHKHKHIRLVHKVISFSTYVQNITTENESRINMKCSRYEYQRRKDGISCWQHVVRMPAMTTTMTSMDASEKCSQIKRRLMRLIRHTENHVLHTHTCIDMRARCAQSEPGKGTEDGGVREHVLIVVQKIYEW